MGKNLQLFFHEVFWSLEQIDIDTHDSSTKSYVILVLPEIQIIKFQIK